MNKLDEVNKLWEAQKRGMDVRFTQNGAFVRRPIGWRRTPTGHTWDERIDNR